MSPASQIYAKITGPIVMVGFGSIGKGTLPLIERHLDYDKSRVTVIDPKDEGRKAHCEKHNVRFIQKAVTMGIAKVNTDSDLRLAALGRLRQVLGERPDLFNLYELMGEVEEAMRRATAERIRLLGSAGKA